MTGLRVLLTEDEPRAGDDAERALRAAGHDVVRCSDDVGHAFPCVALSDPARCPLRNGVVDITLAARRMPRATPTRSEDGVLCSIRHHVPVVIAGNLLFDPFEEWEASAVAGSDDIVETCERVARQPLRPHTEIALAAARDWLERRAANRPAGTVKVDVTAVLVAVRRIEGRLEVEVRAPGLPASDRDMLAVRILAALRTFDRDALGIDVSFVETV